MQFLIHPSSHRLIFLPRSPLSRLPSVLCLLPSGSCTVLPYLPGFPIVPSVICPLSSVFRFLFPVCCILYRTLFVKCILYNVVYCVSSEILEIGTLKFLQNHESSRSAALLLDFAPPAKHVLSPFGYAQGKFSRRSAQRAQRNLYGLALPLMAGFLFL